MVDINSVEGDIFVGQSAEEDERVKNDDDLFSEVVFRSDEISLIFSSAIGGYYPINEQHIMTEDGETVYYPYINETRMLPYFQDASDLELFEENVSIRYLKINGDIFVLSQNEITAYSPIYFLHNDTAYASRDSLLAKTHSSYDGDELLEINSVENPVHVEELQTGYSRPLNYDKVSEIIENDEMNGLLKLEEPEDITSSVFRSL